MNTMCGIQDSGAIELYFYGELPEQERARIGQHLRGCAGCAEALRELKLIRDVLAARPAVTAPPAGDWSAFMQRLDAAVREERAGNTVTPFVPRAPAARGPWIGLFATAALLAVVVASVFFASSAGRSSLTGGVAAPGGIPSTAAAERLSVDAGLTSVGLTHLERSKLVVLGLAAKDVEPGTAADWTYERELATSLLNDTRLYRIAAEERNLTSLAGVMKDLELVLLQTAMAESSDLAALPQIQRLIQKRGLVQKMDVVGTAGSLP